MQYFISLLAAALLFVSPAYSDNHSSRQIHDRFCAKLDDIAQIIMRSRQDGMALSEMMTFLDDEPSRARQKVYREVIIHAWKIDLYDDPEDVQMISKALGQYWHLKCLEAYKN